MVNLIDRLRYLRVRDKLFLTFTGGITLYLLLSLVSYHLIDKTKGYGDTVYSMQIDVSRLVHELKSNLYAVRNTLTTMLLEENKNKLPAHHKKIKEFTKAIDVGIEELLKKPAVDIKARVILTELKTIWEGFRDTRDRELIPHIYAARYKEAKALANGIQTERFERFITLADEAVRYEESLVDKARTQVNERIWMYILFLVIVTALGAGAGFLATLFISREIGDRLAKVVDVARAMAGGNLAERIPVERMDEIGVMAEEFNIMANYLQESYTNLERKVDERTRSLRLANEELERERIELDIMNEELRRASELKSLFLANTSHELRTPLNSVIGFADLLKTQSFGSLNEKQAEYVGYIHTSGRYLLQLINNILDISKIEAGKMELIMEDIPLEAILDEVVNIIRPIADKRGIGVGLKVEDGYVVKADRARLKEILFNLLSNAVKFNHDNGRVDVEVSRKGGEVWASVKDTGIGIKAEDMERIWREFEQTRDLATRRGEGTGLGLPLTKRLIELHGGRIWVESVYGQGSTFTFTLPLPIGEAVPVHEVPPEIVVRKEEEGRPLILVVEDNKEMRELMTTYLREAGYDVAGARDGVSAPEMARRLKPFAMVLDIMLPRKDGWDVLKELKTDPDTRYIPVIIVSALEEVEKGFSFGACEYLTKPIDRDILLEVLQNTSFLKRAKRSSYTILAVDDDPKALELLQRILEGEGFGVLKASSGEEGVRLAIERGPDLIILDLMMPGINGFDVLERLKCEALTKDIPVIIYTARDLTPEDRRRLKGDMLKVIHKGFNMEKVLEEVRRLELLYPTRAKMVDTLTNIFNRRYLKRRLIHEMARGERYGQNFSIAIMHIDHLDEYKKRYGAIKEDEALKGIVKLIDGCVRKADCLVRYDGHTLLLLMPQTPKVAAEIVGEKLRLRVERAIIGEDGRFTLSIGVVGYPGDGREEGVLLEKATQGMESAIKEGGNRVIVAGEG